MRSDCDADRLLAVDAGATGPLPGARPAPHDGICPVRRSGSAPVRIDSKGRARIALRCPAGCRGTLRLVQQRPKNRERLVGRASYDARAGTVVVRTKIADYARRLAGCRGGLRVIALVHPAGDDAREIGATGAAPEPLPAALELALSPRRAALHRAAAGAAPVAVSGGARARGAAAAGSAAR